MNDGNLFWATSATIAPVVGLAHAVLIGRFTVRGSLVGAALAQQHVAEIMRVVNHATALKDSTAAYLKASSDVDHAADWLKNATAGLDVGTRADLKSAERILVTRRSEMETAQEWCSRT